MSQHSNSYPLECHSFVWNTQAIRGKNETQFRTSLENGAVRSPYAVSLHHWDLFMPLKGRAERGNIRKRHKIPNDNLFNELLTLFSKEPTREVFSFKSDCVIENFKEVQSLLQVLYYMRNFCDLIGLEQWYFSLIWNSYLWKLQTCAEGVLKTPRVPRNTQKPTVWGIDGNLARSLDAIHHSKIYKRTSVQLTRPRACLHGGGGHKIGDVTCGGSPHLSCKRDQIKMRDYMDRRVIPPRWVTSPTMGPLPPCKQALRY